MKAPLFFLALASLLLDPALGVDPPDYKWFKDHHTYTNRKRAFDCSAEMNRKQSHLTYCRSCSSVILGPTADITPIEDVVNVCRGQGTPVEGNLVRSHANFRVVRCVLVSRERNVAPPNCVYRPIQQVGQITVGCNLGIPVHFQGCE